MPLPVLADAGGNHSKSRSFHGKEILIALDHSVQSMEAVHYAARMVAVITPSRFVLLHVQPALSQ
jgi:hypothetical protein